MTQTVYAVALLLCFSATLHAQSSHRRPQFDLSQIGFTINGQQICEDKGRLQDYPSKVMDQIIAGGSNSIPALIAMITDGRPAKTTEPIICYWYGMAIGDVAFCALGDLFTDSKDAKTMPGTSWNDMLGPASDQLPSSDRFNEFIKKHGRRVLQAKWQRLWEKYGDKIAWDPKERCFKVRTSQ